MLLIVNVILLISMSTFSASSTAELFRCIDSNGKTNFTDRPCSGDAVDTFEASHLNSTAVVARAISLVSVVKLLTSG